MCVCVCVCVCVCESAHDVDLSFLIVSLSLFVVRTCGCGCDLASVMDFQADASPSLVAHVLAKAPAATAATVVRFDFFLLFLLPCSSLFFSHSNSLIASC